ncbi:MAG: LD-carboxypeptidase [Sphingomonas sp.]|nr:LD-carboxypeptidase [Sphingomonas sp.]
MRIAVVAPAKRIDPGTAALVIDHGRARFPAIDLVVHPQCYLSDGHFAGPDAARAAAFLEVANDPAIDAVWFARGGYGSNRILSAVIDRLGPAAAAKTYIGYSDLGFLLGALYARRIGRPVHGPLLADILRDGGEATIDRSLGWFATKDQAGLEPGLGTRPAAAFNLAILATLAGTKWMPDLTDHVLLVEDVSEPLYRIDRMLFQLANATQLKGLAGVRLGRIADVQPNDPPWTEPVATMITRWCADMGVPFLGAADIGHDAGNKLVPFGVA